MVGPKADTKREFAWILSVNHSGEGVKNPKKFWMLIMDDPQTLGHECAGQRSPHRGAALLLGPAQRGRDKAVSARQVTIQSYSCDDRLGGLRMLPVAVDKVRMMV